MHARIQTWFPLPGLRLPQRPRVAGPADGPGQACTTCSRENTFTWLEDIAQAQALFDQQLQAHWPICWADWPRPSTRCTMTSSPSSRCRYYWSVAHSEWASDVMFRFAAALQQVYPQLLRYAITTFDAAGCAALLGPTVPASGKVPYRRRYEVSTNLTERVEGVRLKHWLNGNSLKLYDKLSVLRPEYASAPGAFKVYRPAEGDPEGPQDWRPLRKGIADLHRRAEVSQAANERYLEALAAVHDTTPLRQLAEPLCRPCRRRARAVRRREAEPVQGRPRDSSDRSGGRRRRPATAGAGAQPVGGRRRGLAGGRQPA